MSTEVTTLAPNKAEVPPAGGARTLLLFQTLLLVVAAAFQLVYLVPRSLYLVQNFLGHWVPVPLRLLSEVPAWSVLVAGLLVAALAVWQRGSLHRLTLLSTAALAVNLGIFLALVDSLFAVLSRAGQ